MTKLEQLINELCPNGVEFKEIGEICNLSAGGDVPKSSFSNYKTEKYCIPIYSNGIGENALYGYTDKATVKAPCVTVSARGTIGYCELRKEDFYPVVRLICVSPNTSVLAEYIKYYMETLSFQVPTSGIPQLTVPMLSKQIIPVPPLPVQKEIVRILDTFTKLTEELTTELTARKKQYEHYSNILLSFVNAKYQTLEELCDIVDYRGKTPRKVDDGIFLITAKNIRKGFIDYNKSKEYISPEDYDEVMHRGFPKIGDVLITTEAPCGNVAQIDNENVALAQRVIKYRPKSNNLNSTFLKYVLLGKEFQNKLERAATGGTVKGIKGSKLHQLTIPVPSIEEQERIVAILDHFDTLCNDISSGLPAEIEARQKQYEYYRDKLLTFKELIAN